MSDQWNAHVDLCRTCNGDKGMRRIWYRRYVGTDDPKLSDLLPCPTCNGRGFLLGTVKDEQDWLKKALRDD